MHSTGMLVPPAAPDVRTATQKQLWDKANDRVGKFLGPDFMANVVPQDKIVPPETVEDVAIPAETHVPVTEAVELQ